MNSNVLHHLSLRCTQSVFVPILCVFALLVLTMAGCSSGGSTPTPVVDATPNVDTPVDGEPDNENPGTSEPDNSSQFTGKLIFSSVLGWPLNIFNFSTNTFDLSLQTDPIKESLVQADLDASAGYAAYTRVFTDGLITGKTSQVILRDTSTEQEFILPFDNGDPAQLLNSSVPSVSSTGIVVFERYTETINTAGLPDDRIAEGISYWNGSGQPIALAASVSDPSKPRITEDGNTVYFLADSDSGRKALWRTSLAADTPAIVWAPASGESLSVNSVPVFDLSDDGATVAYSMFQNNRTEIRYSTPSRSGAIGFGEPTSIQSFGLSGDGSTLMVTTTTTTDDPSSVSSALGWQLHVFNLSDGSSRVAEDSFQAGNNFFPLTGIPAVSLDGDAVAIVNRDPEADVLSLFSLFVFKPGEFDKAQRIVRGEDYGGVTSPAVSMRFRGGVK